MAGIHPGLRMMLMTLKRQKASSTARGYGQSHRKAREAAAKNHHPAAPCARCGHALGPMGPWLHFDHNEARTGYYGFSHGDLPCRVCGQRCNPSAGGLQAGRNKKGIYKPTIADRW